MCYSPIKIKTNKVQYRNGIDQVYKLVPCGKCRECQQSRESDAFVRTYYEHLQVLKTGGKHFFITNTYNDYELPVLDTSLPEYYSLDVFLRNYIDGEHFISESIRNDFLARVSRFEDRHSHSALERPIVNIPRFDKSHIANFFKSLRQLLDYDGILPYESDLQLRYSVYCEYGDSRRRPHYHIEVFMPVPIANDVFMSYCRRAWSRRVVRSEVVNVFGKSFVDTLVTNLKCVHRNNVEIISSPGTSWNDWYVVYNAKINRVNFFHSYGFVNYSKDKQTGAERPVIEDVRACKYLTSYLHYYDNILHNDFYDLLLDYSKLFPPYKDLVHLPKTLECLKHLRDVFPFHLTSQRFGFEFYVECGLDGQLSDDDLNFLKKNEITIPNDTHSYPIPQYLLNRIMYDDDAVPFAEKRVRLLSENGYKVFKMCLSDKLKYKERKYMESVKVLSKFLKPEDFVILAKNLNCSLRDAKVFFSNTLYSLPTGVTVHDVALYDVIFRNVVFSESGDNLIFRSMSPRDILDNASDLYLRQLESKMHFDLYYSDDFLVNSSQFLKSRCFNSLPQFVGIESFVKLCEFVRKTVLSRDSESYFSGVKKESAVRNALNSFIYN